MKMKQWKDCTHRQRVERWVNVERVLKGMSPHERRKHFDMTLWGVKTPCGTIACAAGQCGTDAWFIKRGFELTPGVLTKEMIDDGIDIWSVYSNNDADFKGGVYAVERFFGDDGTNTIFNNNSTRPVSNVIKEVQHYIRYLKAYPTLLKEFKIQFKKVEGHVPSKYYIAEGVEYDSDTRY